MRLFIEKLRDKKQSQEQQKQAAPDPAAELRRKVAEGRFDLFLSYNSEDRAEVRRIAEQLKEPDPLGQLIWGITGSKP